MKAKGHFFNKGRCCIPGTFCGLEFPGNLIGLFIKLFFYINCNFSKKCFKFGKLNLYRDFEGFSFSLLLMLIFSNIMR